jgi:hypothetical protein
MYFSMLHSRFEQLLIKSLVHPRLLNDHLIAPKSPENQLQMLEPPLRQDEATFSRRWRAVPIR